MSTSSDLALAFLAPKAIIRAAATKVTIDVSAVLDADLETFIRDVLKILPSTTTDAFILAVEDGLAAAGGITGAPAKPDPTKGHKLCVIARPIRVGNSDDVIISETWDCRPHIDPK